MSLLEIEAVAVAYGGRPVLRGVSLPPLGPGSLVGILGPNGVGKSTLLRAIAGLQAFEGRVRLGGAALARLSQADRARQVGYLPQDLPQPSRLIVYEAVYSACRAVRPDLPAPAIEAACERAFAALDLGELALRPLERLSGGERQMVGLAQIMVRAPRLYLLDEPTSSLDLRRQIGVLESVRRAVRADGGLCLAAVHDINLALRHCDAIALLSGGRMVACGPPREALTADTLARVFGVAGRIETCSEGRPFVIVDDVAAAAGSHPKSH